MRDLLLSTSHKKKLKVEEVIRFDHSSPLCAWPYRFSHFSDDVVYLARDQLRLEELVKADDDVTKMAALSLKQQVHIHIPTSHDSIHTSPVPASHCSFSFMNHWLTYALILPLNQQACLAVFNAEDTASGIVLSCGGHCATKVGSSTIYTSTRGMVPVLRNRYVFFQVGATSTHASLVGRFTLTTWWRAFLCDCTPDTCPISIPDVCVMQMSIMAEESAVASLCVGLSTPEMPLNTLVGSWKYSIGLCSTGQVRRRQRAKFIISPVSIHTAFGREAHAVPFSPPPALSVGADPPGQPLVRRVDQQLPLRLWLHRGGTGPHRRAAIQ